MALSECSRNRSLCWLACTLLIVALLASVIPVSSVNLEVPQGDLCHSLQVEPPLRVRPGDSLDKVRRVFPSMYPLGPVEDGQLYYCDDTTVVVGVNGSVIRVSLWGSETVCGLHRGDNITRAFETLGHPTRRRVHTVDGNPVEVLLEYPLLGLNVYGNVRATQSPCNASIAGFGIVQKTGR